MAFPEWVVHLMVLSGLAAVAGLILSGGF